MSQTLSSEPRPVQRMVEPIGTNPLGWKRRGRTCSQGAERRTKSSQWLGPEISRCSLVALA